LRALHFVLASPGVCPGLLGSASYPQIESREPGKGREAVPANGLILVLIGLLLLWVVVSGKFDLLEEFGYKLFDLPWDAASHLGATTTAPGTNSSPGANGAQPGATQGPAAPLPKSPYDIFRTPPLTTPSGAPIFPGLSGSTIQP
jgi:hypothetical protein